MTDSFTDVMLTASLLDASRSKDGHTRKTMFSTHYEERMGGSMRIVMTHTNPDKTTKRMFWQTILQMFSEPDFSVSTGTLRALDEMHQKLDGLVYPVQQGFLDEETT